MTVEQLNKTLAAGVSDAPLFVFITGASGAGKTTLTKALQAVVLPEPSMFAFFDSIGVPSPGDMVRDFGSGERWQEVKTHEWVQRLQKADGKRLRVLEGQYNPNFVTAACAAEGIENYIIIDVHSDDVVREARLTEQRQQPELASPDMRSWADFIKRETEKLGGIVLDNSAGRTSTLEALSGILLDKLRVG